MAIGLQNNKLNSLLQNKISRIYGTEQKNTNPLSQRVSIARSTNPLLDRSKSVADRILGYNEASEKANASSKLKQYIKNTTNDIYSEGYKRRASNQSSASTNSDSTVNFNPNLDSNSLASLDVTSELPKLTTAQIEAIITNHFGKSTVIKPTDAQGIYDAQQKTGMSALAILSIGALESGYGTSNIAQKKNNIWGWGAYNADPSGTAKSFSQMSQGAYEFANSYMKTYYNGYGATSIYSAGTGSNPSKKGYAYKDDGTIDAQWATDVGSIMGKFYNTAKGVSGATSSNTSANKVQSTGNKLVDSAQKFIGTPYVWGGESTEEGGMDCSGFVYNALRGAGYDIGRTTANGYRSYGKVVSKEEMQPGDLIFFGKDKKATHIGIYIGNGQMIHSSGGSKNTKDNPGKGVEIRNIDYRSDYLESRRY